MRKWMLLMALAVLVASCAPKPRTYDPAQVRFEARYNDILENQLYPSLVMGVASLSDQSWFFSDTNALFTIEVTAPVSNAVLRVTIDSSNLNYVTIMQEVLPIKGMRYIFYPSLKWKYANLYRTRQQGTLDLTFTCYINDEEVDVKNIKVNYRSANECPLSVRDKDGRNHDFRWLFAGYVNEDHPYVDSIVSEITTQGVVSTITGYQKNAATVDDQVEAIWYYALERGITYASISCTSTPTTRSNVQHIRFFDEVYHSRQANCIDACVFFASIMRKIGLKPVIFVEPCHAYLGYYTDSKRKNLKLLEATMTSWVNFPSLTKNYEETMAAHPDAKGKARISEAMNKKYMKYLSAQDQQRWAEGTMTLDELKHAVSHTIFLKSQTHNEDNYNNNKALFAKQNNMQYQVLDIELLRKTVQPINGN